MKPISWIDWLTMAATLYLVGQLLYLHLLVRQSMRRAKVLEAEIFELRKIGMENQTILRSRKALIVNENPL